MSLIADNNWSDHSRRPREGHQTSRTRQCDRCRSSACTMKRFRSPRCGNIAHPGTGRPPQSDSVTGKGAVLSLAKQTRTETNGRGKSMKKFLLIGLAVSGLALVPWQRADAQITVGLPGVGGISFGFPGGYYAYPTRYNYYPYGYYRRPYYSYSQPYSYYSGNRYSSYNGRRAYHRHHRHRYHYRY